MMYIINKSLHDDQLYLLVNLTYIQREKFVKGFLRILWSKVKLLHKPYPWIQKSLGLYIPGFEIRTPLITSIFNPFHPFNPLILLIHSIPKFFNPFFIPLITFVTLIILILLIPLKILIPLISLITLIYLFNFYLIFCSF